jgi:hypothetical protein
LDWVLSNKWAYFPGQNLVTCWRCSLWEDHNWLFELTRVD